MANGEYWYTKTPINICGLRETIADYIPTFGQVLQYINVYPVVANNLFIKFAADITPTEKTALDGIVAAHTGLPPADQSNMGTVATTTSQYVFTTTGSVSDGYVYYPTQSKIVRRMSASGANRTGIYRLAFQVPDDFRKYPSTIGQPTIEIECIRTSAILSARASMYANGVVDPALNNVNISPTSLNTFQLFKFYPTNVDNYHRHDTMIIEITVNLDSGQTFGISFIGLHYVRWYNG